MAHTDRLSVVVDYLYELMYANMGMLELNAVWNGDFDMLPEFPAACVEPGDLDRSQLAGAPLRTDNIFTAYVMIYWGGIQHLTKTKQECLKLSEVAADLINTQHDLEGRVVQGWVTAIEPGYVRKGNAFMYVTRITWTGMSRTLVLPVTGL